MRMKLTHLIPRNIWTCLYVQKRTYIETPPKHEGGIEYYGFTYYPRDSNFKDPPYEPTKLFLIKRLCKMYGLNPVERHALETLNIDGSVHLQKHIAIVKNIPEINSKLWKVKHLISIKPIKCVNGLPKDGDFTGTYLRDNGVFTVAEKLKVDSKRIEAYEKFNHDRRKFDTKYMRNYLRLKWDNGFSGDV